MTSSSEMKPSQSSGVSTMGNYLLLRGWKRKTAGSPWIWFKPELPSAHYTLQHAYDIQRSLDNGHSAVIKRKGA